MPETRERNLYVIRSELSKWYLQQDRQRCESVGYEGSCRGDSHWRGNVSIGEATSVLAQAIISHWRGNVSSGIRDNY